MRKFLLFFTLFAAIAAYGDQVIPIGNINPCEHEVPGIDLDNNGIEDINDPSICSMYIFPEGEEQAPDKVMLIGIKATTIDSTSPSIPRITGYTPPMFNLEEDCCILFTDDGVKEIEFPLGLLSYEVLLPPKSTTVKIEIYYPKINGEKISGYAKEYNLESSYEVTSLNNSNLRAVPQNEVVYDHFVLPFVPLQNVNITDLDTYIKVSFILHDNDQFDEEPNQGIIRDPGGPYILRTIPQNKKDVSVPLSIWTKLLLILGFFIIAVKFHSKYNESKI